MMAAALPGVALTTIVESGTINVAQLKRLIAEPKARPDADDSPAMNATMATEVAAGPASVIAKLVRQLQQSALARQLPVQYLQSLPTTKRGSELNLSMSKCGSAKRPKTAHSVESPSTTSAPESKGTPVPEAATSLAKATTSKAPPPSRPKVEPKDEDDDGEQKTKEDAEASAP